MELIAQNFKKALRRIEKGQGRSQGFQQTNESNQEWRRDKERSGYRSGRNDGNQFNRKRDLQCHECEGYGHIRSECPLVKRKELKCGECKGFGHTKAECPNLLKRGEKSFLSFSDTESENEEDDEHMINLVALVSEQAYSK